MIIRRNYLGSYFLQTLARIHIQIIISLIKTIDV